MLQVTEKASEMIKDFLKDKEGNLKIRIFLSQGGWSGPSLGMALDEPKDNDETIDEAGISFLIEKSLLDKTKPINVDFTDGPMGSGFSITSNLPKPESSCGGSCSC